MTGSDADVVNRLEGEVPAVDEDTDAAPVVGCRRNQRRKLANEAEKGRLRKGGRGKW